MRHRAIVVGAGPAGLACAAMLQQRSVDTVILEKERQVGSVWRRHYERLHLHTDKSHSQLPGLQMPSDYPRYPSRDQVVEYLEAYFDHHNLKCEFGCDVVEVTRSDRWELQSNMGRHESDILVMATGIATYPNCPTWNGQEMFSGQILHSSQYLNAKPFMGKQVLVVGLGNSGGEIALDLAENGVEISLSVRNPVNIIPKEIFGIPILTISIAQQKAPIWLADGVNRLVQKLYFGNPAKLGLQTPNQGPLAQVRNGGQVPLIDIGTMAAIRNGDIVVRQGIKEIESQVIEFMDGDRESFDAVILCTGYRPDLSKQLPECEDLLTPEGKPNSSGPSSGRNGLYFCGYITSPTGQLREIGIEAQNIADAAARLD